jgi:hypothetical protein
MKRMQILQIIILFIFVIGFFSVLFTTNVYDQVQRKIVEELCLSCIKLKPNTIKEYRFETANGGPHPNFILENLSKGPVILDYRITFCPGCNELEEFILSNVFNYTFRDPLTYPDDPDLLFVEKVFKNTNVTFIHIHTGDTNSKDVLEDSDYTKARHVYDVVGDEGNPMIVFITYGYNHGFIEPYYSTLYGLGSQDYKNDQIEIREELIDLILESVNLYNEHEHALD